MFMMEKLSRADHEVWMQLAINEAEKALSKDEVPVGAVVIREGRLIGRGHNQTITLQDPTAHAEMIAITAAANTLNSWRLEDCLLYVTLEPCTMCAGAIVLARIRHLIFGTFDPKSGGCGSLRNIVQDHRLNHHVELTTEIRSKECAMLLNSFFKQLRNKSP